jgi:hypothetical protein
MLINPTTDTGRKVLEYLKDNPMSANDFGKLCDLAGPTIRKLLAGGSLDLKSQMKVERFFKQQDALKLKDLHE